MEELKRLLDAGHRLIPLKAGSDAKLPRDKGYATRDYTLDELTGNVESVVTRGTVDVNFDWPEAGTYCEAFLPLSGVMFARMKAAAFSPVTHLVYGETLARIDRDRIEILNSSRLSYELSRCARWLKKNKDGG